MSNLKVNTINDASGGSNAQLFGVASPPNSMGFRNRLINGAMQFWQRGTSTTTINSYLADRWFNGNITSVSRSTDVPSGFQYSLEMVGTSYPSIIQRIESFNALDLAGQQVTFSFWAKNVSGSAILYVELFYANSTDNFSGVTSILNTTVASSPSSSWTRYTVTSSALPSQVANGLEVRIVRDNASASTTRITGVQLEAGTVASPFERRDYGRELIMCQRYYQKFANSSAATNAISNGFVWVSTAYMSVIPFVTNMRAAPTGTTSSATAVTLLVTGTAKQSTSIVLTNPSTNAIHLEAGSSGMTAGQAGWLNFTGSTDFIALSAEL